MWNCNDGPWTITTTTRVIMLIETVTTATAIPIIDQVILSMMINTNGADNVFNTVCGIGRAALSLSGSGALDILP